MKTLLVSHSHGARKAAFGQAGVSIVRAVSACRRNRSLGEAKSTQASF